MKRPHQKSYTISDMTEEERLELADKLDDELRVIEGSGNVFADLGLENAKELKAMADKMIAEGIPEDQIVSALQSITPNDGEMSEGYYHHVLLIEEIRKKAHEVPDEPKSKNK